MLKHLIFAITLAVSTLLVTGAVTGAAQASTPGVCASAHHVTQAAPPDSQCVTRADGCYYCYSYRTGSWERQHCGGASGE
ncbi:hypothetical protein [Streptosporangium lutulentum]|uniref:Secreted protein n=1 Tax=Streptosporangium lutulentum TaxID=1461250 RepID=A0ABT9QPH1_9ACTN|nr:hypothetical protein [Streptosporangium lutulentum]MDP9848300.1 hypothetical protein [Streptosporangium lutulentum]